jgi:hypothetical protein
MGILGWRGAGVEAVGGRDAASAAFIFFSVGEGSLATPFFALNANVGSLRFDAGPLMLEVPNAGTIGSYRQPGDSQAAVDFLALISLGDSRVDEAWGP